MHVVLRVTREVRNMRTPHAYRAISRAIDRSRARTDFRITQASIQSNHLHFAISAAKRLNRELRRRKGDVFAFRYHATAITTPTQARNATSYIVNNWRHHRRDPYDSRRTDPYASAHAVWRIAPHPDHLPVVRATTWLLTEGLKRAGPIFTDEVPGPDPQP